MGLTIGFDGDLQLYLFEAVRDLGLVVVELDDIGVLVGEDLRYLQQLARFIRKLYGEAEDAAARDECLVDERGDRGNVDIAAAHDGRNLFALEGELAEAGQAQYAGNGEDRISGGKPDSYACG